MIDLWTLARFVAALIFVIALIGAVAWVARRYAAGGAMGVGGRRRLTLVESLFLDGKSRLVLIRRDEAEHLLVVSPQGAVVVESHIAGGSAPGIAPAGKPNPASGVDR